jgi:DtxR family transcriptional regulator, Mn-dependent transcriptional regulator
MRAAGPARPEEETVSTDTAPSAHIEEYLEQIYRLSREQDEVTTTDVARSLKISPASVTGMLKRLGERGLIHHEKYHGITLSEQGRTIALATIRRHGLLERLLVDVLDLPWHLADEEAGRLEHYITPEVEARLQRFLGNPQTCPHGQPINWTEPESSIRLGTLQAGTSAVITRIGDESAEFLQYVASLGMKPDAVVDVVGRAPFNGPLMVRVGDQEHALGDEVCARIWVKPREEASEG